MKYKTSKLIIILTSFTETSMDLIQSLKKVASENKEVYLCGDFNIDLLKVDEIKITSFIITLFVFLAFFLLLFNLPELWIIRHHL